MGEDILIDEARGIVQIEAQWRYRKWVTPTGAVIMDGQPLAAGLFVDETLVGIVELRRPAPDPERPWFWGCNWGSGWGRRRDDGQVALVECVRREITRRHREAPGVEIDRDDIDFRGE